MAANTVLCALLAALLTSLCAGDVDVTSRQKRPDQRLAELQTLLALETWRHTVPKAKVPDPNAVGRKRSPPPNVWRYVSDMETPPEEYGSYPGDWSLGRYLRPLEV